MADKKLVDLQVQLESRDAAITEAFRRKLEERRQRAGAGLPDARRTRGWAVRALMPRIELLREAIILSTPIREQQKILEEVGIVISYNALRRFMMVYLGDEYFTYLANSRTRGKLQGALLSDIRCVVPGNPVGRAPGIEKLSEVSREDRLIDSPEDLLRLRNQSIDIEDYRE